MSRRRDVLVLYRTVFRTARSWIAVSGRKEDSLEERQYIETEARTLFRRNMNLKDPEEINLAIEEGQARLQLALHYRNPYPRPVNLPPLALAPTGKKLGKAQQRRRKQAKPIYIRSSDEYDKT